MARRHLLASAACLLTLAASSCASLPPFAGTGPAATARIALTVGATKGYQTQDTVHRWVAGDVYRYDLSLTDESSPGDPTVASTSIQAQGPLTQAVFGHLQPGHDYRAQVEALGNIGADPARPLQVLNSQTPTAIDLDFAASQNLQDSLSATASVTLDSTVFSGSLTVQTAAPADTATLSAALYDSRALAAPLYTQTFAGRPSEITFDNLATGIPYEAILTADKSANGGLWIATTSSTPVLFDPSLNDLASTASASTGAWSSWAPFAG